MPKLTLNEHEQQLFDLYYIGIVSMARCHPSAKWDKESEDYTKEVPSLLDCANESLNMILTRRIIMKNHSE